GDAHMPLHTSSNYDGQLTGQKGIHAFWEAQLPEQFGETYNLHTRGAKYISDVTAETWRIIKESHALADTMLAIDRELSAKIPYDKRMKIDANGDTVRNKFHALVHTDGYALAYHTALKGMVERQLQKSIEATADFWYTAWVNAGKPDLSILDDPELTAVNKVLLEKDYNAWKNGKLTKIKTDKEF
ncbi:MAG TPA: hypothetical protein VG603_06665, partial [Chitinophagales bacterium]|nr:hypothetical protein [Chitinophagales bacterium]